MVVVAAHQMKIGRRQNRHGNPGIGEPRRDFTESAGCQQRHLGHMADRNPPAAGAA